MYEYDSLRWKVNFKVDKETHDLIEEMANHRTQGNISAMMRVIISEWIAAKEQETDGLPRSLRIARHKRRRKQRETRQRELRQEWASLQLYPDPKYEADLAEEAKEYDLPWPPDKIKLSEADPDLIRVLGCLREMWWDGEHCGSVTFRELRRRFSRYEADDLRQHLRRLKAEGEVILDGDLVEGRTTKIVAPGVNVGDNVNDLYIYNE